MRASARRIISAINAIQKHLTDADLLYIHNTTVAESLGPGKKRITWATDGTRPDLLDTSISNIEEYIRFIRGRHYQFMLIDGSIVQMSFDIDSKNTVLQSRLVWYPCPVVFEIEELEQATIEELVLSAPTLNISCRAPFRIDFAPALKKENHPSTHLHLGHEEFRLPLQRALEPSRFMRLIVRTAYPKTWASHEQFRLVENWSAEDRLDEDDKLVGALGWTIPLATSNR